MGYISGIINNIGYIMQDAGSVQQSYRGYTPKPNYDIELMKMAVGEKAEVNVGNHNLIATIVKVTNDIVEVEIGENVFNISHYSVISINVIEKMKDSPLYKIACPPNPHATFTIQSSNTLTTPNQILATFSPIPAWSNRVGGYIP